MNVSCAFSVFVIGRNDCVREIHFCVNAEFFVGECTESTRIVTVNVSNFTHVNVNLNVIWPEAVAHPICCCCEAFDIDVCIIVNYTDRKLCKCCCACCVIFACTCDNDFCCVVFHVNGVCSSKACCEFHVVEFPVVAVVEVDNCFNFFDCFNSCSVNVHPVE